MNIVIGVVNKDFKAIVSLPFHDSQNKPVTFHNILVDTGFDGEICMPCRN